MNRLIELGFWGNGLIRVSSLEMKKRYNQCLIDMGLEATALEEFRIDCMGWSPEVAHEKGDVYYLSHGAANQMAIILTPDQQERPIYAPFHSFDLTLMKTWFSTHRGQIVELTKSTGIWLHIDQKMDTLHDPNDILLIDNITIHTCTPSRLIEKAAEQKDLVRQFMASPRSSSELSSVLTTVPEKLRLSVIDVGSVAYRQMVIEDVHYSVPCSFYVRAFGGLFVLRSVNCEREEIISKNDAVCDIGVTSAKEKKILKTLEQFGLISYEVERWVKKCYRLEMIRDSFLIDVLEERAPEMNFVELSAIEKKKVLNSSEIKAALSEEYVLLDQLIVSLNNGRIPKRISSKIRPYLVHPLIFLESEVREVIWYLLTLICDCRPVIRLYRYDKDMFIQRYNTWNVPRRSWAIECIKQYNHRNNKIVL